MFIEVIKFLIPNLLTFIRLLAGPLYLVLGVVPAQTSQVILLSSAVLTDIIDGKLARLWNTSSGIGAALDTTADKVFILCLLMKIALGGLLPWWTFWLVALQYLLIAVEGSLYLRKFSMMPIPDLAARLSSLCAALTVITGILLESNLMRFLFFLTVILNFWHVGTAYRRLSGKQFPGRPDSGN